MISSDLKQAPGASRVQSTSVTRALVTGASGFIGGHLIRRLNDHGSGIVGLVRAHSLRERLQSPTIELREGDVTDRDSLRRAVAGVDVVFHLAGLVKARSADEFLAVNQQGISNLLAVCGERETPPTVVIVSSLAAAGPSPEGRLRIEEDPVAPVSNYGRSKRAGELIAEEWAGRIPITIVRPPIVFGEHDTAMLNVFQPIRWLRVHAIPGFRVQHLSLIHADDLAMTLIQAAERGQRLRPPQSSHGDQSQGYYFAAADETLTMGELGQLIGRVSHCSHVTLVPAPNVVAWFIGGANELVARLRGVPTIVGLDKIRDALAGSWTCSNERARRELGLQIQVPLAERMQQTADFYFRVGWLK